MRLPLAAILAAAVCFATLTAAEADEPAVVDLQINAPPVITVGDHIAYTVTLEVDAGAGVALAAAALPPSVALVDTPQEERAPLDEGRERVTLRFTLAPFAPGEIEMPPLALRYTNPDGTSGTVEAFASAIEVTSVLPQGGQVSARDLKPQAEVGTPPPAWPAPLIAGLLTVGLLLVLTAFLRHRIIKYRAAKALRTVPVFLGPEDMARHALDRAGAEFRETGDYETFYTAIGNAVRDYLTRRYQFPAFAMTTRELETEMISLSLDRWQVRVAVGLLEQCDAVIYARYRPVLERAEADLTAAYEVVEMSRPPVEGAEQREEVAVS